MLQLTDLTKTYGSTVALDGVSLTIAAGEIVCLLGPSGCGKTTLLRTVAGLESADSGTIHLNNKPIEHVPPHARGFGMMFQDFALFPHLSVAANIGYGPKMRGDGAADVAKRVTDMLALVDLAGYGNRSIEQLSGGEKQRVALARSLATSPQLLMLDEPLGALDRALRERLMLELRAILKRVGVTAIYVTHDQTEAFAIADKVVVMNGGSIEQVDAPQVLYNRPKTTFVAKFLGFTNLFEGTVTAPNSVETDIGTFAVANAPPGQRVMVHIEPAVAPSTPSPTPPLQARITAISFRGRYYQMWCDINERQLLLEVDDLAELRVGDVIGVISAETKIVEQIK